MELNELLKGRENCECGKSHICPIEHVVIGENAIAKLPDITAAYRRVLVVADLNTKSAAGDTVYGLLKEKASYFVYQTSEVLVPDEKAIEEMEGALSIDIDLIVGVGSGVINDLCKYVSFKHGLPYYIVATAPSMDGYASKGAALILDGMKVTITCDVPKAIVGDTAVLKSAPFEMIQAGYGDIIGKYSCLNDWKLSHLITGEYLCDFVWGATLETVEKTVALADGLKQRETQSINALMESLVIVGILMAYVGNSRPASGSEHHLSHYFEIVGLVRGEEYFAHGIDVCFSAIETAKLREELLEIVEIEGVCSRFDQNYYQKEIERIYGKVSLEVLALQEKMGWYKENRLPIYKEKWMEIKDLLRSAPTAEKMLALTEGVGLSYENFKKTYGEEKIRDAHFYAKDLKDRYSVLWLYFDLKCCSGGEEVLNVYDFDDTILEGDSERYFWKYIFEKHPEWKWAKLRFKFFRFLVEHKLVNEERASENVYKFLRKISDIQVVVEDFWLEHKKYVKAWYIENQRENDIVISATPEFILKPIMRELGIKYLIASKMDEKTGRVFGKLNFGEEKVANYKKQFGERKPTCFYSDSDRDLPMAKFSQNAIKVVGEELKNWF